jgi:hypothetical protein
VIIVLYGDNVNYAEGFILTSHQETRDACVRTSGYIQSLQTGRDFFYVVFSGKLGSPTHLRRARELIKIL